MIIKLLRINHWNGKYIFVRAKGLPSKDARSCHRLIRCTQYTFDRDLSRCLLAGNLGSKALVGAFEKYLVNPDRFPAGEGGVVEKEDDDENSDIVFKLPALTKMSGPGSVFHVMLLDKNPSKDVIPCLVVDVNIRDIISFIDDGDCRECHAVGTSGPVARAAYPMT